MVAQARFPEAVSGEEVNSISCMEHHLRDDQGEIVSCSLVTMELKLMVMTSMFLDVHDSS